MKRRISTLIAAGLVCGTAGWLAIAGEPVAPAPVRLLKPIADSPVTIVTPKTELQKVAAEEPATNVSRGFPVARETPASAARTSPATTTERQTRRSIFAPLYENWGQPRQPAASSAEQPQQTTPPERQAYVRVAGVEGDEEIPPPSTPPENNTGLPQPLTSEFVPYEPPPAVQPDLAEHPTMVPGPGTRVGLESFAPPYLPANNDDDALPWTAPFVDRAMAAPVQEELSIPANSLAELPFDFMPWWEGLMDRQMRNSQQPLPVDIDLLTIGALEHSPQILSLRTDPAIRSTYLYEESAAFDWRAFWDTKWSDLNNPVGNSLTTGGPDRFKDQTWSSNAGLRQRNVLGGELEISQRLGHENQNSIYFIPPNQGTARFQVSYTQPLLNGSGRAYNRSRIMLAQIDSNRSFDEVSEELQNHLLKVTEAYWELYRSRAAYLQRQKLLISAEDILDTLGGRQEVDALQRQVLRAQAAVASRRSEIVRTAASIRNSESRLRLLVNDPRLLQLGDLELVPYELPRRDYVPISMTGSLQSALVHRPDISQAIRDLRTTGVRLGIARNELLPRLDVVLQSYVAGLAAGGNIGTGYNNQFADGRPSYSAGLEFEMPLGNRAANARYDRRQLELTRAGFEFRTRVETGLTEVELAVRETETAYREMVSQYQALVAAQTEASYLDDRWRNVPGDDRGTTLLLEDLLDAQERLADTESSFVGAQTAYVVSLSRVRKSMGTLLQAEYLPFAVESQQQQPLEPTPFVIDGDQIVAPPAE